MYFHKVSNFKIPLKLDIKFLCYKGKCNNTEIVGHFVSAESPLKILSIKAMGKLAKIIRSNFFRIQEINQRYVAI